MLGFLKKLLVYWFFLAGLGYVAYFASSNLESIYVHVPQVGEFKAKAAIVYLAVFFAGCLFSSLYFAYEMVRHQVIIRQLRRQIPHTELKQTLPTLGSPASIEDAKDEVAPRKLNET